MPTGAAMTFLRLSEAAERLCDDSDAPGDLFDIHHRIAEAWRGGALAVHGCPWDSPGSEIAGHLGEAAEIKPHVDLAIHWFEGKQAKEPRIYRGLDDLGWNRGMESAGDHRGGFYSASKRRHQSRRGIPRRRARYANRGRPSPEPSRGAEGAHEAEEYSVARARR